MYLELIHIAPLSKRIRSRDGLVYMERAMKFIGWMPPKSNLRWIYKVWSVLTTVFFIGWLPLAFFISYGIEIKSFTAGEFLTSFQVAINVVGCSIKSSITYARVECFSKAKKLLDRLDKRCTSDEERAEIHRVVARSNLIFLIYQAVYSIYATSSFLAGVFVGRLPWRLYNPFINWRESKGKLLLASVLEYVLMIGAVEQEQLDDVYAVLYCIILRTHIGLLKKRVQRLRSDSSSINEENLKDLIDCITDHKLILEFCNTLRPVIAGTIFVQFLLIGVVMGLSMINVLFFADLWTGIATCVFIVGLLIETFPFCYICNMIQNDSADLADAIFQSNWIDADCRYKSTLIYFLHKAQQPIIFIAGGVFIVCLNTYITVAKLAFSVVTFVQQMDIADKFT